MKLIKKKKGFTLIELMAVIAIVAVLAAVLVPTVNGYITRAKKTAIITECRVVMNAIETYNAGLSTGQIAINDATAISDATKEGGVLVPLVTEGLLETAKISHIQKATIANVKKINDNSTGDIVNKIEIDSSGNFTKVN